MYVNYGWSLNIYIYISQVVSFQNSLLQPEIKVIRHVRMIDLGSSRKKQSARFIVPFPRNGSRSNTRQSEAHFRLPVYRQTRLLRSSNICSVLRDISADRFLPRFNLDLWLAVRFSNAPPPSILLHRRFRNFPPKSTACDRVDVPRSFCSPRNKARGVKRKSGR